MNTHSTPAPSTTDYHNHSINPYVQLSNSSGRREFFLLPSFYFYFYRLHFFLAVVIMNRNHAVYVRWIFLVIISMFFLGGSWVLKGRRFCWWFQVLWLTCLACSTGAGKELKMPLEKQRTLQTTFGITVSSLFSLSPTQWYF